MKNANELREIYSKASIDQERIDKFVTVIVDFLEEIAATGENYVETEFDFKTTKNVRYFEDKLESLGYYVNVGYVHEDGQRDVEVGFSIT